MTTEDELCRRSAYRRTWKLIHQWKAPEGIEFGLVCYPLKNQVDVYMTADGLEEKFPNFTCATQEGVNALLDFMAHKLMARVVAAYRAKDASDAADYKLYAALDMADRKFVEGLESALCRGKGGGS